MFVRLGAMPTGAANEFRLRDPVAGGCVSAGLAAIRRVPGGDLYPRKPSVFRLSGQNRDDLPPASITDTPTKTRFGASPVRKERAGIVGIGHRFGPPQHVGDRQILDHNQLIAFDQSVRGLVVKISALIGDLAMPRRYCLAPKRPTL